MATYWPEMHGRMFSGTADNLRRILDSVAGPRPQVGHRAFAVYVPTAGFARREVDYVERKYEPRAGVLIEAMFAGAGGQVLSCALVPVQFYSAVARVYTRLSTDLFTETVHIFQQRFFGRRGYGLTGVHPMSCAATGHRGCAPDRYRSPIVSVFPEVIESLRRHLRVSHGMLDVLVAQVALVGKLVTAGMSKHVRVD